MATRPIMTVWICFGSIHGFLRDLAECGALPSSSIGGSNDAPLRTKEKTDDEPLTRQRPPPTLTARGRSPFDSRPAEPDRGGRKEAACCDREASSRVGRSRPSDRAWSPVHGRSRIVLPAGGPLASGISGREPLPLSQLVRRQPRWDRCSRAGTAAAALRFLSRPSRGCVRRHLPA